MQEMEAEVRDLYSRGDLELAVHRVFERHQAKAIDAVQGVGASARGMVGELVFGVATGVMTMGIPSVGGVIAGATAGAAKYGVTDVTKRIRRRRAKGWLSVLNRLNGVD